MIFHEKLYDKELIVRKKFASLIEKVLMNFGYDHDHDSYKDVVYQKKEAKTKFEIKGKMYYDAYCYLMANRNMVITISILKRFFYLILDEEVDERIILDLTTKLILLGEDDYILEACKYHIEVYKSLSFLEEEDRVLISLMFFNMILVKNNIPALHFVYVDIVEYRKLVVSLNTYILYEFFIRLVEKNEFQESRYYDELYDLSQHDLVNTLKEDISIFKDKYRIKKMIVFGSFAKNTQRIDSDIDLAIMMSFDLKTKDKLELIDKLKEYLKNKFKRFIDIQEIGNYIGDEISVEFKDKITII